MSSLRYKLVFSYGLLIVVIFAVSAWGVYHLLTLGRAIDVILTNNYRSILAAENMTSTANQEGVSRLIKNGFAQSIAKTQRPRRIR